MRVNRFEDLSVFGGMLPPTFNLHLNGRCFPNLFGVFTIVFGAAKVFDFWEVFLQGKEEGFGKGP